MQHADHAADRLLGAALVTASAAVFGVAGVLTKSIQADPLTISCWRGLVGGLAIMAYVLWRRTGDGASMRLGWRGWLMAVIGAIASIAFIAAFKHGYVANVAIIYATSPFVAALLSFLLIGEAFRGQTLAAATLSGVGVAIMVFSGLGHASLVGDLLALVMTVLSALYMVLIRKFRQTPVVWAGAVSGFLIFALGWLVADPLSVDKHDVVLLFLFGLSFALASILWTEGARLIPAAEAGLLGSAEVPFAILFAWIVLAELPPLASFIGGAIVLVAVFAHAGLDFRAARRQRAATMP